MDQLLKYQVTIRMRAEFRTVQQAAEVFDIAVKISSNHDIPGASQVNKVTDSSRRITEGSGRLLKRLQKAARVGHELKSVKLAIDDRETTGSRTVQPLGLFFINTAGTPFAEIFFYD
jgi:hypothetical protein